MFPIPHTRSVTSVEHEMNVNILYCKKTYLCYYIYHTFGENVAKIAI